MTKKGPNPLKDLRRIKQTQQNTQQTMTIQKK